MSIVTKIDSLIKMIEIKHRMDEYNRDICYAHGEVIIVGGEEEHINICGGIHCSNCIFHHLNKDKNIQELEELKKLAALNELITPTK